MNRPTVFIKSADGHKFSVDVAFLGKCSFPHLESTYTLINEFRMIKYLHNLNGPAVNNEGYFLLGVGLPKETFLEKSKNFKFSNKLGEILDE